MTKRRTVGFTVILGALALLSAALLPSCGRLQPVVRPTLVVSSYLWSPQASQYFIVSQILPQFEREHGCRVEFTVYDRDTLRQRTEAQDRAGVVTTDVAVVYVAEMKRWVEHGWVEDLTEQRSLWDGVHYLEGVDAMTLVDGRRYFVPVGADVYLLCADRQALPHLPEGADVYDLTWAEFSQWAKTLAQRSGAGRVAFAGVPGKFFTYQFGALALSHGGGFPDVASPGATAAWKLLQELEPWFCPGLPSFEAVSPALKRREAWLAISLSNRLGSLHAFKPGRFVIAPVPRGPAGRGSVAGVSGYAIRKDAPNPELAVAFLEFMSRPEIQLQIAKGTGGYIPPVREALDHLGDDPVDEVIRRSVEVLATGRLGTIPPTPAWGRAKRVFDELFHEVILERKPLDPATLREAQARIDALVGS